MPVSCVCVQTMWQVAVTVSSLNVSPVLCAQRLQDYGKCLELIDTMLQQPCSGSAFYPMFTKAMIYRQQGQIKRSLAVLEDAIRLDPQNEQNLKQIGHSLHLMGKHQVALEVYDEALRKSPEDWELFHNKGLCYVYLKQLREWVSMLVMFAADMLPKRINAIALALHFALSTSTRCPMASQRAVLQETP